MFDETEMKFGIAMGYIIPATLIVLLIFVVWGILATSDSLMKVSYIINILLVFVYNIGYLIICFIAWIVGMALHMQSNISMIISVFFVYSCYFIAIGVFHSIWMKKLENDI